MDKLDGLVTQYLVERLFEPERLAVILTSLTARRAEKAETVNSRIMRLQLEVTDSEDKLKRLYRLVEDGLTDLDDVLKDRLNSLKADRDRAKAALETAKSQIAPAIRVDPALIERFGRSMREKFTAGSVPFRKAYLQSLIDVVEIDDHQIRINGSKDVLERAVLAEHAASQSGSQMSTRWPRFVVWPLCYGRCRQIDRGWLTDTRQAAPRRCCSTSLLPVVWRLVS
jgi:site-specific DNA recombinase